VGAQVAVEALHERDVAVEVLGRPAVDLPVAIAAGCIHHQHELHRQLLGWALVGALYTGRSRAPGLDIAALLFLRVFSARRPVTPGLLLALTGWAARLPPSLRAATARRRVLPAAVHLFSAAFTGGR